MTSAGILIIIKVKKIYLVTLNYTDSPKSDKMWEKMHWWKMVQNISKFVSEHSAIIQNKSFKRVKQNFQKHHNLY